MDLKMAHSMALLWIALGVAFIAALVFAMAAMNPDSQWEEIAPLIASFVIVLTLMGAAFFVLFGYIKRR